MRNLMIGYIQVIKSFEHKGLENFFTTGSKAGITAAHATKISDRLAFLHAADTVDDMDKPGYRLHELKGDRKGLWAVDVSKNWRIVFEFKDGDAFIVNYEDYH
jgi:toxin HigB-1